MAGSTKRYFESTRNKLSRYLDVFCVACDMEDGGCFEAAADALRACDRRFHPSSDDKNVPLVDRKPTEVIPVDLGECVRATAALRRCMQAKPDVFGEYIAAMDKGIEEDERLRRDPEFKVEDGPRFRWWTGMRNS